MSPEETLVRRVLELWASKDPDALVCLFAEDGVYDNVPDASPMRGRAAIRAWLDVVFQHCIVEVEIQHIAVTGEWVLSERLDAHVFPDGRRLVLPVMNASRVVDGKVVQWRDYYCRKTVAELGMGPADS